MPSTVLQLLDTPWDYHQIINVSPFSLSFLLFDQECLPRRSMVTHALAFLMLFWEFSGSFMTLALEPAGGEGSCWNA